MEQKPACSQPQMEALNQLPANEDCLYLNVFKPKQEVKEGYPAFVFVHGGAFQVSLNLYEYLNRMYHLGRIRTNA